MKAKIYFLVLLLIVTCVSMNAEPVGKVKRTETTPEELRDLGITYERLAFSFPQPVLGRFWIEFWSGNNTPQKQAVPSDAVPAATRFDLGYVQTHDQSAFVSVTTTHDGHADRRTCGYSYGPHGGTRTVTYFPTSDSVPVGIDFELFSSEIKPNWRHSGDPIFHYRVMAHFTISK